MPLNSGNFLESQRSLSIDISKQMTRVGSLVLQFHYKDMDNDLGPRGNGPSVGIWCKLACDGSVKRNILENY